MAPQHDPAENQHIVTDAAALIASGQTLDDAERRQALGWGAKITLETDSTPVTDVLILVAAGNYGEAIKRLVDLGLGATTAAATPSAPPDLIDGILAGGNEQASNPTPGSARPAPPPRQAAATPAPSATPNRIK